MCELKGPGFIEDVLISAEDFKKACDVADYVVLKGGWRDQVRVETNPHSRREFIRYGIPFKYVNA